MKMRKISDRLYEFFELGPDDDNREVTEVAKSKTKYYTNLWRKCNNRNDTSNVYFYTNMGK